MTSLKTAILIVGAGPTGLAAAISLVKHGFRDILLVEETASKGEASRAITIHAATLEALDSIGCAESLVKLGIKGAGMVLSDRSAPFMSADFATLAPYTKFPFVLIISQTTTERVLERHLKELNVQILRPETAIGLRRTDRGELEVTFDSGKVITAQYVIGADGARSVIRQLAGVGFADPDGTPPDERLAQMILADVIFSSSSPSLPTDRIHGISSGGKLFLAAPMPKQESDSDQIYRIGFNLPASAGPPPSSPSTSYLQQHLDEQGPLSLSSDPSVNPTPIHISKTIWATRFRTHAAIADKSLIHMGALEQRGDFERAIVLLVGDAAHIHAPAGGLGMNLGIRDAITLGPVLAKHAQCTDSSLSEQDKLLEEHMSKRHNRALSTIKLTKQIMSVIGVLGSTKLIDITYWFLRLIGKIPFVRARIAWNLSSLGSP